ncbi:MAG: UvrD-helicase domain-containing protein [Ignavibacteriae bacterium]|nr:UvrD-helicase domain-containing protein [Ignavibacteriota bacterium]
MTFLHNLNTPQQDAVKALEGPVLIVAGAGSGKTRVLTYRIAHLLSIGVPAYQILALTFTNKAANEMKERIHNIVGEKSHSLWMGTFHSIFARILRYECTKIGFEKNFSIYDDNDSIGLIKRIMNSMGIPTQQFNPNAIQSTISNAKNQLVTPDEFGRYAHSMYEEKTTVIFAEYQKQLLQSNAMDFDDLLLKPITLFHQHSDVLQKYQDRFRFILVDEYQDTNHVQYVLLKTLAEKYKNICVVGDDAQSIYAFRGADIRNILDFQKDYPGAKTFRLEQNYRSTKFILSVADRLIKHNQGQIPKTLWTDNDNGDPIHVIECVDDREEGSQIVNRITNDAQRFKLDLKHFAVLYRTNAQSRSLEDAMRKNSIPYVIVGGVAFYQRKEIKDLLAYFRVIVNPQDTESLLRIVNFPVRGLGDVALGNIKEFAVQQNISLLESVHRSRENPKLSPRAKSGAIQFSLMTKKYTELKNAVSMSEFSRAFVDEIGVLKMFKEEATPESMARWENVQELLSAISEFQNEHPEATFEQFLEEVALVSDIDQWEDKHNAITLMTLHSAKGLEFPVVFVAGLEEGLLPFYPSQIEENELEEERRLLYVGITRAMKKLYLTYTRSRYRFGDVTLQSPSRFISEIQGRGVEAYNSFKRFHQRKDENRFSPSYKKKSYQQEREIFADTMPDYESMNDVSKGLRVGSIVEHEEFGRGRTLSISGKGEMMKAVVLFESVGAKSLMVKYARLLIYS